MNYCKWQYESHLTPRGEWRLGHQVRHVQLLVSHPRGTQPEIRELQVSWQNNIELSFNVQ